MGFKNFQTPLVCYTPNTEYKAPTATPPGLDILRHKDTLSDSDNNQPLALLKEPKTWRIEKLWTMSSEN